MEKVGILTHYGVNNQGAQLQLYAMYHFLKEQGYQPVVLEYQKNFDFEHDLKKRYQVSIRSVPYFIREYLIKSGVGVFVYNIKREMIHNSFRKQTYEFCWYTKQMDAVVIGSDQVMELDFGINIMMFGHLLDTNNIIAYAPSFGQNSFKEIERRHCRELIESGLKKFSHLSARDKNSYEIIKSFMNEEIEICCDPTILYCWDKILKNKKRRIQKKYLVVYSYSRNLNTKEEIAAIKRYATEKNMLIVSPGAYHSWCDKNIACSTIEWLQIVNEAEEVITDTFHGTVIATICNRPLAVYIREEINKNKLSDITERLGISDRVLGQVGYEELKRLFSAEIDFIEINKKIARFREESKHYLLNALNSRKDKNESH